MGMGREGAERQRTEDLQGTEQCAGGSMNRQVNTARRPYASKREDGADREGSQKRQAARRQEEWEG